MSQAGPQDREPTVRMANALGASVSTSTLPPAEVIASLENAANQHGILSKHTKQVDRTNQAYPHLQQDQRLDNRIWITTPEQIRFRYSTVGAQRRFVAFGLDLVYMFGGLGVIILMIWITFAILQYLVGTTIALRDFLEGVSSFATLVTIFVIYWFGTALQEYFWGGKTLGKMTLGIRVVSMDGRPPSLLQSFGRNFLRLADGLPAFPLIFLVPVGTPEGMAPESVMLPTFLVGLTSMLLTRRFQRVGDLFAGTMVIDHEKYQDASVPIFHDRELLTLALSIPRDFHPSRDLLETLSLYVSRRVGFHHQRRVQMTSHLAAPLLQQWSLPPNTNYDLFMGALYVRSVCEYSLVESMLDDLPPNGSQMQSNPMPSLQAIPAATRSSTLSSSESFAGKSMSQDSTGLQIESSDFAALYSDSRSNASSDLSSGDSSSSSSSSGGDE